MRRFIDFIHKVSGRAYTLAKPIDVGRGQTVVLLHGIGAKAENWQPVVKALNTKKQRVIALDLLGFGQSPQPDWLEYSVEDHAKAVLATLRRLRLTRKPIILVGHSMGSLVAARITNMQPDLVKHLVLYQMPVYGSNPAFVKRDYKRQAYLSFYRYLAAHPTMTLRYTRLLGRAAANTVGLNIDEKTWKPFELSLLNTIVEQNTYEDLQDLRVPTDVIYGRYDFFVLRNHLKRSFKPSDSVRFYELKESHRISDRTAGLLAELISQDPLKKRTLTTKYAKLVTMKQPKPLRSAKKAPATTNAKVAKSTPVTVATPVSATKLYIALAVLTASTVSAWQGKLPNWEFSLFDAINGWQAPGLVDVLARIGSDVVWLAVGLVVLAFLRKSLRWTAWRIGVPAAASYIFIFLLEHIVGRPRPNVLGDEIMVRAVQSGMGFPSGHVGVATAILIGLWPRLNKPLRLLGVLLVLYVGWARIYLGVHFPLDVVGGVAAGALVCWLIVALPRKLLQRFRMIEN